MSTWMRAGSYQNLSELLEAQTPQPNLTPRMQATASPRLKSILLDVMSSALLRRLAFCLLTETPLLHPLDRRMGPELILHINSSRPKLDTATGVNPHTPDLFLPPPLPHHSDPLFQPLPSQIQLFLHLRALARYKRKVGLLTHLRVLPVWTLQDSGF